jgi:hypothetical protein
MISDLEAVVDRVDAAEISLLGQYNSCRHATAYAARHPGRLQDFLCDGIEPTEPAAVTEAVASGQPAARHGPAA